MAFPIDCECGRNHEVTATMAGTSLACSCGREVAVPLLSELRARAGQERYITNAAERIGKLLRDGYVPPGQHCLSCGDSATLVLYSQAVCEQTWRERKMAAGSWTGLILMALFLPMGWLAAIILGSQDVQRDTRERGRDVVVSTPIRLCRDCANHGAANNERKLRALLQQVPEYAALLAEYPQAKLVQK